MTKMIPIQMPVDTLQTIIESLNDRLETVEDLIAFEESNGNQVDVETLQEVREDIREALFVLGE